MRLTASGGSAPDCCHNLDACANEPTPCSRKRARLGPFGRPGFPSGSKALLLVRFDPPLAPSLPSARIPGDKGKAAMATARCAACRRALRARPRIRAQRYSSAPACQRVRRERWQSAKRHTDPDYRENQARAQERRRGDAVAQAIGGPIGRPMAPGPAIIATNRPDATRAAVLQRGTRQRQISLLFPAVTSSLLSQAMILQRVTCTRWNGALNPPHRCESIPSPSLACITA